MVHLESHVATKTFSQVNRTVKTLVVPGISFGGSVGGTGFGGSTINLGADDQATTPSPEPFGDAFMTIHDLIIWNPTGDGRANLSQIHTNGTRKDVQLDSGAGWWNFSAGPLADGYVSRNNIHSPIHDPDVRGLYPESPCRTTDAKLCVDVNMGGGSATVRAVPFTKDMAKLSPKELHQHILADRHVVQVIDIGGDGKRDKRLCFPKWVQSRKAVGEFSNAKIAYPALTGSPGSYVQPNLSWDAPPTDVDGDGLTFQGHYPQTIYSDEFCYGGWVFMFENIAPAAYGSLPFIRMASVVNIQVQLSLADNHIRELGPAKEFGRFVNDHYQNTKPGKVVTKGIQGSPVDEAIGSPQLRGTAQKKPKPSAPPRKGGVKNLRGSYPPAAQSKMSQAAAQNRQETWDKGVKALKVALDVKQRFDALTGRRGKKGPRGIQNTPHWNASLERPFGRSRRGKFRVADGREL